MHFSRAYLRHLVTAGEMLAMRLAVLHNLHFYNELMQRIRDSLDNGTFEEFRATYSGMLEPSLPGGVKNRAKIGKKDLSTQGKSAIMTHNASSEPAKSKILEGTILWITAGS